MVAGGRHLETASEMGWLEAGIGWISRLKDHES